MASRVFTRLDSPRVRFASRLIVDSQDTVVVVVVVVDFEPRHVIRYLLYT